MRGWACVSVRQPMAACPCPPLGRCMREARGITACSAGNHAQAAARSLAMSPWLRRCSFIVFAFGLFPGSLRGLRAALRLSRSRNHFCAHPAWGRRIPPAPETPRHRLGSACWRSTVACVETSPHVSIPLGASVCSRALRQGVAFAATALDISAKIFMPKTTPQSLGRRESPARAGHPPRRSPQARQPPLRQPFGTPWSLACPESGRWRSAFFRSRPSHGGSPE